jgi:hypothetical protein
VVFGAVLLALAGTGVWLWVAGGSHPQTEAAAHHRRSRPSIAPWSLIATVNEPTPGYVNPDATAPFMTVPPTWADAPSSLPIIASVPGWNEVRLVARPPAAGTAWIPSASASITRTPYRIVVDLTLTRLLLFRHSRLKMCAPAGVGTAVTPTPVGHYFVALFAQSPTPEYGSFVMVTSAFADTVTDWQQAGDPIVTIEGPLASAAAIGRSGARVTTGSVRLLGRDLDRLRVVPSGTPIDVVNALRVALTPHERKTCKEDG